MSEENARRGVHVSGGEGIVAHLSSMTAFAKGDTDRLNELLVRLSALADASWQETVRTITAGITEAGFDDHPSIACVSVDSGKLSAFVYGAVELAVVINGGTTILDGRDSSTWIDVVLRGEVEQVHAGTKAEAALIGILRDGVIPAGGFLLETAGPLPATGQWDAAISSLTAGEPVDESADSEDSEDSTASDAQHAASEPVAEGAGVTGMFARIEQLSREETTTPTPDEADPSAITADVDPSTVTEIETGARSDQDIAPEAPVNELDTPSGSDDASAPEEAEHAAESPAVGTTTLWKERPELRGVLCSAGHFTAPEPTCRTCGEPVDSSKGSATGVRPVLGHLIFDDGAVLDIDRPVVVGADVPEGYSIDSEPTTVVRLDDGHGGVSAVQLEVRASGWNVEIVDMHSENGTYTMLQGERQTRTRLRSGQAVTLRNGMTVETGTRTFTFGLGPHS